MLMDLVRHQLQLTGNSGKVPNPFGWGELTDQPEVGVLFKPGSGDRPNVLSVRPEVVQQRDPDGTERYHITAPADDPSVVDAIVNKLSERARKRGLVLSERSEPEVVRHIHPSLTYHRRMDMLGFVPGLLKIAYELTCMVIGDAYLDDPVGTEVRTFLMNYDPGKEIKWPRVRGSHGIGQSQDDLPFELNGQVLGALVFPMPGNGGMSVMINVLGVFCGTFEMSWINHGLTVKEALIVRIDPVTGRHLRLTWHEWFRDPPTGVKDPL